MLLRLPEPVVSPQQRVSGLEHSSFILQHHRNAIAYRKRESIGATNKNLLGLCVLQRAFAQRTGEDVQQLRIHAIS
jgi:hypothetical protein